MLFCAVGLLAASAAMAGVPSASTSTQPVGPIYMVGTSSPTPDPFNAFSYTIRDASSNLVPGSVVILNFAGCTDARVCPTAAYASGITVNCAAKTMTGVTNGTGQITFSVVGSGKGAATIPLGTNCITVTADGVALSNLSLRTPDYNGQDNAAVCTSLTGTQMVSGLDLGQCYSDFLRVGSQAFSAARSDLNRDNAVTALDLGVDYAWSLGNVTANSSSNSHHTCPNNNSVPTDYCPANLCP
jgi:hypothetical protein